MKAGNLFYLVSLLLPNLIKRDRKLFNLQLVQRNWISFYRVALRLVQSLNFLKSPYSSFSFPLVWEEMKTNALT
nr:hypothetical transcript [Hymenolepis microstoma]